MATVFFASAQRRWVDGDERADVEAGRVAELIAALYARYPDLEGKLEGVAVSIDGDIHNDARYLPLRPDSEVHFMGAIAGGSGERAGLDSTPAPALGAADPLGCAHRWHAEGAGVALATVVETWGSSPCPAGSQLAVDDRGHFEGSVSGGCVEGAVIESATRVIRSGEPLLLEFGVADEEAWDVGLACGGRVRIWLERVG